jgi:fatty acid desaturase
MFVVPIVMFLTSGHAVTMDYAYELFFKWVHIMIATNVLYVAFFINRGHHMPQATQQGDEIKSFDFGEYQISTTVDRTATNKSVFKILVYHGEQVLHQLFPSIDAAYLPHLKETLIETCKEFDIEIKKCTIFEGIVGQCKQLYRTELSVCKNNNANDMNDKNNSNVNN